MAPLGGAARPPRRARLSPCHGGEPEPLRRRLLELRHQRTIGHEGPDSDPVARLDVARALAALPAGKRACVVLRHLVDLSVEETASVLGISTGSVKSQTHKGLRLLEAALSDRDDRAGQHAQEVKDR